MPLAFWNCDEIEIYIYCYCNGHLTTTPIDLSPNSYQQYWTICGFYDELLTYQCTTSSVLVVVHYWSSRQVSNPTRAASTASVQHGSRNSIMIWQNIRRTSVVVELSGSSLLSVYYVLQITFLKSLATYLTPPGYHPNPISSIPSTYSTTVQHPLYNIAPRCYFQFII